MNATSAARYCDGRILRSLTVDVSLAGSDLQISSPEFTRCEPVAVLRISSPLAHTPRFVRFPDGAVLELDPESLVAAELDRNHLRPSTLSAVVHWLESRTAIAAAATFGVCAIVGFTIWLGLPKLARHVAMAASPVIETNSGRAALSFFRQRFPATQLTGADQRRVQRQVERLTHAHAPHVNVQLHFCRMGFANAFALPGGFIVVSDELVQMAANDEEIAAVLAHELGHVELRHGLQSVLRNSAALVVVSTVTGDLSTLTAFSGTLPFLLFQRGYDRQFEREADAYAVDLLRHARINPAELAYILERLENARPATGADFTYLSTHPSTSDRVKKLRAEPGAW
jgi:Zn-dependent protease with chaperone function